MCGYQPETLDQPTHPNTTSSLSHVPSCETHVSTGQTDPRTARRADARAATQWTDPYGPTMPDEEAPNRTTCFEHVGRFAGTHGDVLNVHTEAL